jgi:hypothetical protein
LIGCKMMTHQSEFFMKKSSGKQALINWSKNVCKSYPNVSINDFSMSWRDGIAFLAILHNFLGEEAVGEISSLKPNSNERENLDRAFAIATKYNIEQYMSTDDILFGKKPEALSMETQVIQFFLCFKDQKPAESAMDDSDRLKKERMLRTMSFDGREKPMIKDDSHREIKPKVAVRRLVRVTSMMESDFDEVTKKEVELAAKLQLERKIMEEKARLEEEQRVEREKRDHEEMKAAEERRAEQEEATRIRDQIREEMRMEEERILDEKTSKLRIQKEMEEEEREKEEKDKLMKQETETLPIEEEKIVEESAIQSKHLEEEKRIREEQEKIAEENTIQEKIREEEIREEQERIAKENAQAKLLEEELAMREIAKEHAIQAKILEEEIREKQEKIAEENAIQAKILEEEKAMHEKQWKVAEEKAIRDEQEKIAKENEIQANLLEEKAIREEQEKTTKENAIQFKIREEEKAKRLSEALNIPQHDTSVPVPETIVVQQVQNHHPEKAAEHDIMNTFEETPGCTTCVVQ